MRTCNDVTQMQKTAVRLVELMGLAAALNCCYENKWLGMAKEIKALRDARRPH